MQYLAFDVSKDKLDAVLTNLRTRTKHYEIRNDAVAIERWLAETPMPKKLVMGCESTGNYHLTLARACIAKNYLFKVVNPIVTKQFTRATIRKRKTDMTDALIIAKLLAQGEGHPFVWNAETEEAKTAQRVARRVALYASGLRLLRGSMTVAGAADAPSFAQLSDTIAALEKEARAHDRLVSESCGSHPDVLLLQSIVGIGPKLAPVIWSEIGSIERFANAKQLVAYAGLDPKIRQSGHTLNTQGKLTKRGSPYLRRALFIAASSARRSDPELKAYYEKKRSEGKKFTVAVCATARKLVNRIYAVWSRRTPYTQSTALTAV